jgi:hypothetical protein
MKPAIFKKIFLAFLISCFGSIISVAQDVDRNEKQVISYSKAKLQKFVEASKGISLIQQMGEQKMIAAIEEKNLDVDTFNKIAEMHMNPAADVNGVSEKDMESFNNVIQELQVIQTQMEQEMELAITSTGMNVEEYIEIMEEYHKDPDLQQQINELLEH